MTKRAGRNVERVVPRPVTDALRRQVREELPEIALISNPELQAKVAEAWAFALAGSSFKSIREIPPAGNPGTNEAVRGDQTDHLRGVTRIALQIAEEFIARYPELDVNRDTVIAGGLVHDVGKAWEFDPVNRKRWKASQKRFGKPSIRHPAYGAHICLTVGLPEEIVHIAMAHSGEGELLIRSVENTIIHHADYAFWYVLLAGGMIKPETVREKDLRYVQDKGY